jgi:hypothetical protein
MSGHFSACPEGQPKIAQRFSAGDVAVTHGSDVGEDGVVELRFHHPYGTATAAILFPALKRGAIFTPSLPGRRKCPDISQGPEFLAR